MLMDVFNILVLLYFVLLTSGYIALFVSASVGIIQVRRDLEGSSPESVSNARSGDVADFDSRACAQ